MDGRRGLSDGGSGVQEGRSESPEDVSQEAKRPKLKTPDREKGEDGSNDREDDAKDDDFGRKTSDIANAKGLDESEEYGRGAGNDHATDRMDVDESGGDSGVNKKGCEEKSKEEQSPKTENETIKVEDKGVKVETEAGRAEPLQGEEKGKGGVQGEEDEKEGACDEETGGGGQRGGKKGPRGPRGEARALAESLPPGFLERIDPTPSRTESPVVESKESQGKEGGEEGEEEEDEGEEPVRRALRSDRKQATAQDVAATATAQESAVHASSSTGAAKSQEAPGGGKKTCVEGAGGSGAGPGLGPSKGKGKKKKGRGAEDREPTGEDVKKGHEEWLVKGGFVEVRWGDDWWQAKAKRIKTGKTGNVQKGHVYVSYVGGTADDDEWVSIASGRLRKPQEDFEAEDDANEADDEPSAPGAAAPAVSPNKPATGPKGKAKGVARGAADASLAGRWVSMADDMIETLRDGPLMEITLLDRTAPGVKRKKKQQTLQRLVDGDFIVCQGTGTVADPVRYFLPDETWPEGSSIPWVHPHAHQHLKARLVQHAAAVAPRFASGQQPPAHSHSGQPEAQQLPPQPVGAAAPAAKPHPAPAAVPPGAVPGTASQGQAVSGSIPPGSSLAASVAGSGPAALASTATGASQIPLQQGPVQVGLKSNKLFLAVFLTAWSDCGGLINFMLTYESKRFHAETAFCPQHSQPVQESQTRQFAFNVNVSSRQNCTIGVYVIVSPTT